MKIFNSLIALWRDRSGGAFIEFGFVIPIFVILLLGTVEIANLVYAGQKSQSAAEGILNIVNLQNGVKTEQLQAMARMLPEIVKPFEIGANEYRVHITMMQRKLGDEFAYVRWQKSFGGGIGDSSFAYNEGGTPEENRVDPGDLDGFVFSPGDQVLVAETYMFYRPVADVPLMDEILGLRDSYVYHRTPPMRPRMGSFEFHPDDVE